MNWRTILIVSLAGNILLAAVVIKSRRAVSQSENSSSDSTQVIAEKPALPDTKVVTNLITVTNLAEPGELRWPTWTELDPAGWGELRTNLLAVGCPPGTVRDILIASLRRQRYAERRPVLNLVNTFFWDELARNGVNLEKGRFEDAHKQLEEIDSRFDAMERDALAGLASGNDEVNEIQQKLGRAAQFSHLDPELQQKAVALVEDYERKRDEFTKANRDERNRLTPEGTEALAKLERDHKQQLGELMGPEATAEWRLRSSGNANWARNVPGLEASEDELRQIAGWKLEYGEPRMLDERFLERYGLNAPRTSSDPDSNEDRLTQTDVEDRIKELLGDERYTQYQLANNGDYRSLYDLADRYEMPEQTASQALQMQQDAQAAADQIRANPDLTGAQRRDALRAIQQETRQAFQGFLGDDAYYTYQRHGGDWLNGLSALNPGR